MSWLQIEPKAPDTSNFDVLLAVLKSDVTLKLLHCDVWNAIWMYIIITLNYLRCHLYTGAENQEHGIKNERENESMKRLPDPPMINLWW